jgi:hypothetical protein
MGSHDYGKPIVVSCCSMKKKKGNICNIKDGNVFICSVNLDLLVLNYVGRVDSCA